MFVSVEFCNELRANGFKATKVEVYANYFMVYFGNEIEQVLYKGDVQAALKRYISEWVPGETKKGEIRIWVL